MKSERSTFIYVQLLDDQMRGLKVHFVWAILHFTGAWTPLRSLEKNPRAQESDASSRQRHAHD